MAIKFWWWVKGNRNGQKGNIQVFWKELIFLAFPFSLPLSFSYIQLPTLHHFHLPFLCLSFGLNPTHTTPHPTLRTPTSSSPVSSLPRSSLLSKSVALSFPSTGTTSRRCSLDHRGMAFWEQPSYARCITNEFRYLQQSVGAKSAPSHSLCFQCIINYLPNVSTHTHKHTYSHHSVATH